MSVPSFKVGDPMGLKNKKNALAATLFVISVFILCSKLLLPTTVQIITQDQSTYVRRIPNLYTLTDVALIVVSSFLLTASSMYLLTPTRALQPPEGEKRKLREATLKTLKGNEKRIYQLVIDENGVMFQSELVEKSKLPKSSVSLILDRLEARGLLEKRRHGISNVIILK